MLLRLLRFVRPASACQRALRAAIAAHRPAALRALLAQYGDQVFVRALRHFSNRVIDDALSMLSASDRARIRMRLCAVTDRDAPTLMRTRTIASSSPL